MYLIVPGRFTPNPFPPLDVSPQDVSPLPERFAPTGRFTPGRFAPKFQLVGGINVEIYVYYISNYTYLGSIY